MQLFNTKVVPASVDATWSQPPLPALEGAKLLVISTAFADDSAEAATLQNMMKACKVAPGEYAVLKLDPEAPYAWHALSSADLPKHVLLLGVTPAALSIHALFRLYVPNAFSDKIFIAAPSLLEITHNSEAKKALWIEGLKPVFGG